MILNRLISQIQNACNDIEEYTGGQKIAMEEHVEAYESLDRTQKIIIPVDVTTKKRDITDIIKRLRDENSSIERTIKNYEQMLTILDEKQEIYNNAIIGTLAQKSLDVVNRYNITPHDVPSANVLEFARQQASRDLEASRTRIGGRRTRRNTKRKKKRKA